MLQYREEDFRYLIQAKKEGVRTGEIRKHLGRPYHSVTYAWTRWLKFQVDPLDKSIPKSHRVIFAAIKENPDKKDFQLPTPMSSDKRDPFTEMELLFKNFQNHLLNLIPIMVDDVNKENYKKIYQEGYARGQQEGPKTLSQMLKERL